MGLSFPTITISAPSGEKLEPPLIPASVAGFVYFAPNPVELFQGYAEIGVIEFTVVTTKEESLLLKSTKSPPEAGNVAGLEYFVPNPEDHAHTVTKGELKWATAIALPALLNVTPLAVLLKGLDGSEYFVPNPEDDQGYAVT